ncbi:hypothetical protein HIM_05094 [Hirsutella minnesotensis 3608]|uniref:Uncharacterized protein n=1 Tax=Hirsutella minnesotensis 3608 TaxID=1043627 RepID=A0A0F7ZKT8_9HYPO|nr:hypothetical protein HIM_05094 [Hirsutella minnesotensis 3608]
MSTTDDVRAKLYASGKGFRDVIIAGESMSSEDYIAYGQIISKLFDLAYAAKDQNTYSQACALRKEWVLYRRVDGIATEQRYTIAKLGADMVKMQEAWVEDDSAEERDLKEKGA